jgi:hypothetical protein
MAIVDPAAPETRRVSVPLIIGIVLVPIVFSWFLLRKGHSTLSRVLGFGWLGLGLLSVIGALGQPPPAPAAKSAAPPASSTAASNQPAAPTASASPPAADAGSRWVYSDSKDDMRGTVSHFAAVESQNALDFQFPYKGGHATLNLRNNPSSGLNIYLSIEGQFICSPFENGKVSAKFDDGPVRQFRCSEPSDQASGVLFINSEKAFLAELKKAKTLTVEAEFFRDGERQMTFDVHGLKWP